LGKAYTYLRCRWISMGKGSTRRRSSVDNFPGTIIREAGKKGLGLFAQKDIARGSVVTRMMCPTCITTSTSMQLVEWWESHSQKKAVPRDSAIFLYRSPKICKRLVYDAGFVSKEVPEWGNEEQSKLNFRKT